MRRAVWGWLAVLTVLVALPAAGETMYARLSAPVRSDRTLRSREVGRLEQGQAVNVTGRRGRYYRVLYRGQTGWVYFNKLAAKKPEDIGALLGGGFSAPGLELENPETGGALRGLSAMAEDYLRAGKIPSWAGQQVEAMQARSISPEELEEFQREGGLGEYAQEAGE